MKWQTPHLSVAAVILLAAAAAPAQTSAFVTDGNSIVRMTDVGTGHFLFRTGAPGGGQGQSNKIKDDLFAGTEQFEKNATSVTEIDMDPDSLDQVRGKDAPAARSTVLNVVRTYSYDKPGMFDMAAVDKYREKLNTGEWHCSVHQRELKSGQSTDVCRKHRSDDLREDAIITVGPRELTFIHHIKREVPGGHSDVSGMPLFLNGTGSLPMLASLGPEISASMAEFKAEHLGEMLALQAELKAGLASGDLHVFSPEGDNVIRLRNFKTFKPDDFPAFKAKKPLAPKAPEDEGKE